MIAPDTCVFARWVMRDDPAQTRAADRLLAEPFFLGATVLMELGWILKSVAGMDRNQIARTLASIMGLPTAYVENEADMRWAVERYAHRGDLEDLIHLAASRSADQFATFDKRLPGQAGANPPVAVLVIGV